MAVAPAAMDVAIENVTVIDPSTRRVLPARTVYVRGDRIVEVAPADARPALAARTRIDGRGRFLIPGLMDMHVHLFLPEPPSPSLNLLLANGVTSIREMSSDCWDIAGESEGCISAYQALQANVRAGSVPGPDIVALTSSMVMGPSRVTLPPNLPRHIVPSNEADARTLVGYFATRGVDLIKTHDSIPDPAFRALMDEAARRGMRVGGHIPFRSGAIGAARLGYRSIEHARDLLYDCSRYGEEFRSREAAFAEGRPGAARPANLERLSRTVAEFDDATCRAMLAQLSRFPVFYTPTHVTREMEARAEEPSYRNDPSRKYVPTPRNSRWEADLTETASLPPREREALKGFFAHGLRITGLAHLAGIPVMAGTDANDTMIVPGFSLHRELQLLRRAGLSAMDVLRAATAVPANYLGRRDLGGIAAGMEADLVLLRANPLVDIANASSIEAVLTNGRVFSRAQLDELLAAAERLAAASRP
jgi:hypothetical protein